MDTDSNSQASNSAQGAQAGSQSAPVSGQADPNFSSNNVPGAVVPYVPLTAQQIQDFQCQSPSAEQAAPVVITDATAQGF